jgi:site-specific recombinase XerD
MWVDDLGPAVTVCGVMLEYFTAQGWQDWDLDREPLIRNGMPVLIDDDLRLEDADRRWRPAVVANRWLRELPVGGAPSPNTWRNYATAVRGWLEFLAGRGVDPFGGREALRAVLGAYAGFRLSGPVTARLDASTWNLHVTALSGFYQWAVAEGYCQAVPFTFARGRRRVRDEMVTVVRNTAKLRTAKRHATVKYLEPEFAELFVKVLAGLGPDGSPAGFRGWETARNAAMGALVLGTGLRRREFTHLLAYEVPALPARRAPVPVLFAVPGAIAKGGKLRTTWVDHDALARVHQYMDLERAVTADRARWRPPSRWGPPLPVADPDRDGGRVNGRRVRWAALSAAERLRLVAPDGGSCLLALRSGGAPFVAWPSVFARASARIWQRVEPRFPTVSAHRLRHSFAMLTLARLVRGYYRQAAGLVADTGADAALAWYLAKADPLLVLRDLLGHSSVTTTEVYLRRLDVTRIYRDACQQAGAEVELTAAQQADVDAEFNDGVADAGPGG